VALTETVGVTTFAFILTIVAVTEKNFASRRMLLNWLDAWMSAVVKIDVEEVRTKIVGVMKDVWRPEIVAVTWRLSVPRRPQLRMIQKPSQNQS